MDVPDSPVFAEYRRQLTEGDGYVFDLTALWRAAGRPRGKSPRQWDARNVRRGSESAIVAEEGSGPNGPVLASDEVALDYAQALDFRIEQAIYQEFCQSLEVDPVGHLLESPEPLMALAAVQATINIRGGTPEEAARYLTLEAVDRTADLGTYAQETKIAAVQRALRGEPALSDLT